MKTIEDAVIEMGGKLPNPTYRKTSNAAGWYISSTGKLTHAVDCVWFEPEEFESTAKRMGYINGYEWSKEYPTSGKRPELPDDVLILAKLSNHHYKDEWSDVKRRVGFNAWGQQTTAFKVIDPRYKPVSEISESKHDAEAVSEKPESNWFERGELPPVGVECEVYSTYNGWVNCKILAHGICCENGKVSFWQAEHDCGVFYSGNRFRPIRTHREKVIEAASERVGGIVDLEPLLSKLYDAGMLVLPQDSSDTKD